MLSRCNTMGEMRNITALKTRRVTFKERACENGYALVQDKRSAALPVETNILPNCHFKKVNIDQKHLVPTL